MSAEEVDCTTMTQILHMHTIETIEKQSEDLNMVGTRMAKVDTTVRELKSRRGRIMLGTAFMSPDSS